jgi:hypothetical protein
LGTKGKNSIHVPLEEKEVVLRGVIPELNGGRRRGRNEGRERREGGGG